jgi:hypothetical protein
MATFVHAFEPLSAEHAVAFDALMEATPKTVAAEMQCFLDGVSAFHPYLRTLSIREFLGRNALAVGDYSFPVRRVRVRDVNRMFGGMVPPDHPGRIRVVPGAPPAPTGTTVPDLSPDFREYVRFVSESNSLVPFPYARDNAAAGLVVAGGSVLSEMVLPESEREERRIQYVDASDPDEDARSKSFRLKGPVTDIDNFITVPHAAEHDDTPARDDARRKDAARRLAIQAVQSVSQSRFVRTDTCMLCQTEVHSNGYAACLEGHLFHSECYRASKIDMHANGCAASGCFASVHTTNPNTSMQMEANRSTINVAVPDFGETRGTKPQPIWQLTSRVFPSVDAVAAGFDFAVAMCTYDGLDAWTTELGAFGIANGVMLVSPFHMSSTCEMRTVKYVSRYGFDLLVVGTTAAEYDAMVVPCPVRGIRGIKWLVNDMQAGDKPLASAWSGFCKKICDAGKCLRSWFDANGIDLPLKYVVAYSKPYDARFLMHGSIPDNDSAVSSAINSARKTGRGGSNLVDMQTLDMVRLLSYTTFQPGRQLFFHSNFQRIARPMGRAQIRAGISPGPRVDAVECMQMWDPSFVAGVFA